ncbi:hypothetical protein ECH_0975 [Ehrlichia chaffeensis str. Arkansas]|uniref:Uncharacterized protein n=1 Tax=Ehrlichia chaffeensis (strain ATCC CRL-10679 / Arkansas) TaxID=205920 RepID=Q2GFM1_EHRCR|nr:hypothetical protein ECH_0975 [Ehrlichia chaffeensis str. Arkansas]
MYSIVLVFKKEYSISRLHEISCYAFYVRNYEIV